MADAPKDWQQLIETAVTLPGSLGDFYSRFHDYSFLNRMLLHMQGVAEPVAPYKRWKALGRQVIRGARAYEMLRPMIVNVKAEEQEEPVQQVVGFKSVRALFALSQTIGKALPPIEVPGWDLTTALNRLGIREMPFESTDGNMQGYSRGLEFAINPLAANRNKTLMHELGHIVLGHTLPHTLEDYATHRGVKEFQAESAALIALREVGLLDAETATNSRGYIQHWLAKDRPPDKAIQQVFSAADSILRAGRLAFNPTPDE